MKYSKEQIGLWKTEFGSIKTHAKGLTQNQIDLLKSVKVGDLLIIFKNDEGSKTDYSLRVILKEKEPTTGEF